MRGPQAPHPRSRVKRPHAAQVTQASAEVQELERKLKAEEHKAGACSSARGFLGMRCAVDKKYRNQDLSGHVNNHYGIGHTFAGKGSNSAVSVPAKSTRSKSR